ncbi:MAG: MgtC/SapB family protein [Elusimicrobia bacterium]|nr:MgtC/SapB family protein [Elusimicrobiota bacterium]
MSPFLQDSLSLSVALLLGAAIGLERELSDKAAGLRTNILICVGAALFTVMNMRLYILRDAHLIAQIVAGVGFLGAGAIMRDGEQVKGLTTAATIWVVAAVGMAAGAGDYEIAAATTVLVLVVQSVFPRLDEWVDELRQRHTFRIASELDDDCLEQIKTVFRDADVKVLRRKLMKKDGMYLSEWYVSGPRLEQKNVVRKLLESKHVRELTY